jgi:anaerobic magnesium-protoporphyrin IX monomethyl ester cyclase
MKVVLIRAPMTLSKYASAAPAVPPIGLAYVAASVLSSGNSVKVIDPIGEAVESYVPYGENTLYRGLTLDSIVSRIEEADLIGLSVMFSQDWPLAVELINSIKAKLPSCNIVIGGEHAAAEPFGALEDCANLDYVITGEGDQPIVDLISALKTNAELSTVSSLYFRGENNEIIANPKRPRIRDLDDIPLPAWDLFPLENYLSEGHGWGVNRGRSMPIVASRGCPYQCTFCSNPNMWTTRWVVRKVDKVIEEIVLYIKKYNATNFDFQDLTAIVKKDWIKDFCLKLIDLKLDITWQLPTGTRTEAIDEEVAILLYKAGCKNITYAPESGSSDVLRRIKKKISTDKMLHSAKVTVKAGLDVKFNFIFGFPEDKYIDFYHSIIFMIKLAYIGVSDISIAPFSPYPGSELFFQLQKSNRIPKKLDADFYNKIPFSDMSATVSWCNAVNSKNLNRARNFAMIVFYLVSYTTHPTRPFVRVLNFFKGVEESRMDKALGDMRRRFKFLKINKTGLDPKAIKPF